MTEEEFCKKLNYYEELAEKNLSPEELSSFRKEVDEKLSHAAKILIAIGTPIEGRFDAYRNIYLSTLRRIRGKSNMALLSKYIEYKISNDTGRTQQ